MDLETFVSETLVQVVNGIARANTALAGSGAIVNPKNVYAAGKTDMRVYGHIVPQRDAEMRRAVHAIDFDVAITATEGSGTKGGIGVVVGAIALGTQGSSTSNNSSMSRVQFSVPVALPQGGE
jgi:hypothetical protein